MPILVGYHFADENDLPDVVGIVRQLPVDGFEDGVGLVADIYFALQIGGGEGV